MRKSCGGCLCLPNCVSVLLKLAVFVAKEGAGCYTLGSLVDQKGKWQYRSDS